MDATPRSSRKRVNLALQGGGAHGAFVWGVLDALLEDGRLEIEAISATSAGAMNAVVLAYGLSIGGVKAARDKLHAFWSEVAQIERLFGFAWSPWDRWVQAMGLPPEYHPSHAVVHAVTHILPPQVLNPLNVNPLRALLLKVVDFERLNGPTPSLQLYLNATNIRTGKIAVFETPAITVDAVLASACLPPYFQAVEIDGEHYWDGGYLGNPAIYPLIYRGGSRDVIIVQVTPITRAELPHTAAEVMRRINEISFNSSLMREMRAVAFATKLIDDGELDEKKHSRMFIHWIGDDATMAQLASSTQFHPDWNLLCRLRDDGRATARQWLAHNIELVGHRSTIDFAAMFL